MKSIRLNKKEIEKFIFAGRSIFTVKNEQTGNRFTYRIDKLDEKKQSGDQNIWFAKVLTGPDNESSYSFIGSLWENAKFNYRHSKKSHISENAQSVVVLKWFLKNLVENTLPDYLSVYHEGSCGRCGRTLTVPESIQSGYGPECVKFN